MTEDCRTKGTQTMTQPDFKGALKILKSHNTWRRGCDVTPMTDPKELGVAIDTAIAALLGMDALMQEPTADAIATGALAAGIYNEEAELCFKAMRDRMLNVPFNNDALEGK